MWLRYDKAQWLRQAFLCSTPFPGSHKDDYNSMTTFVWLHGWLKTFELTKESQHALPGL